MATVTITKMADWSLYPGDRGFNAVWAFCKTSHSPTGGCYYPADLRTIYNVPGSEISYATWFSNLASAGVNLVRIKMTGRNRSCAGDICGFEPPPYGTFNIWQSDLHSYLPGDLPGYRADQITYPPGAAAWNASNLKEAVEQAEANSVQFMPIFFEAKEFTDDWQYHPWYNSNKYVDGTACVPADQGFIANAFDFYTDATAKTQAKARIKCAIDLIGGYNVVKVWALFSEIPWCMVPSFWGEPSWNAATIANIRTKTVPWVAEMAQYIRDNDVYNRPISLSHARTDGSGTWDPDPDYYWNVMNEPFQVYPLDVVECNYYEDGDIDAAITHLDMLQTKHHPRVVWPSQYWPFDGSLANVEEVTPFLDSKEHEWLTACGAQWAPGPLRWPGIKKVAGGWQTGGYADSNYDDITGVTGTFAGYVYTDWNNWADRGTNWDANIATGGAALDRQTSWGCTERVMFFLNFTATGNKTVTVSGVTNGGWHVYLFDWEDGTLNETKTPVAAGGSFSFTKDVSGFDRYVLVGIATKD